MVSRHGALVDEDMRTMIRATIAIGLVVVSLVSCTSGNSPPDGGPINANVWVKDSHPVSTDVINSFAGAKHCDDQDSTFLVLGWPLGTAQPDFQGSRWYVRNPNQFARQFLMSEFAVGVTPPQDAQSTGYTNHTFELWLAPSDEEVAAYIKVGGQFERWPRSKQALMCV